MPDPTTDPVGSYWADTSAGGTEWKATNLNARETRVYNAAVVAARSGNDFVDLTASPYNVSTGASRAANTAALVQAYTDAAKSSTVGGKKIYLPGNASAYPFNHTQPTVPGQLVGDGMGATRIDVAGTSALTVSAFQIFSAGGDANKRALSVQATAGATTITGISSTGGWAVGDWVLIRSTGSTANAFWPGSQGINDARRGEFVRISSIVSGTSVTVWEPLEDTYLVADTCYMTRVVFWRDCGVEGLTFENSAPLTSSFTNLVTFRGVQNLHMAAVEVLRSDSGGLVLDACMEFEVYCYPRDLADDNANSRWGYGTWLFNGCQDGTVTVHSLRCRHAFTTGADWMGVPRHITVRGTARECTGTSFDTHAEGEDIIFDGCHAFNSSPNGYSDSAAFGFYVRSPKTKIKGGMISQVFGWGVSSEANATDMEVSGVTVDGVSPHTLENSGSGIWIQGARSMVKNCSLMNLTGNVGVEVSATGQTVVGNVTRRTSGSGGSSMQGDAGATATLVKDNVARGGYSATFVSGTTTGITQEGNVTLT